MKYKVLLIDDSKVSIAYYRDILKNLEIDCDGSTSASEGIQKALENNYDCIITDYEMPEMNGGEVVKLLKEAFTDRILPIIVLTSKQSEKLISEVLSNGADNYILKKEEPYSIALKIKNAINTANLQRELIQTKQNKTVKEMIATYNHEFNNVLAILQMDIKIYTKKYHQGDDAPLKGILKTTDRLIKLVEQIGQIESYEDQTYIPGIQMVKLKKEDQ